MEQLDPRKKALLGQLLVLGKHISDQQLQRALREQGNTQELLGQILVRHGSAVEETIARTVSEQTGIPLLLTLPEEIPASVRSLLSHEECRQHRLLPLARETLALPNSDTRLLRLAMANPFDAAALDHVRAKTGLVPFPSISPWTTIQSVIDNTYERQRGSPT